MGFRGRNPPASLKHGILYHIRKKQGVTEFPGEKSPGLIEAIANMIPCCGILQGFRGRNPPASLKPGAGRDLRRHAGAGFRGRNPPASLKRDPLQRRRRLRQALGGFRGRNPPASLKRALPADLTDPAGGSPFPGEKSPGLIEARRSRSSNSLDTVLVSFRGRNPPASLKLRYGWQRPAGSAGQRFRGRNPPASLKQLRLMHYPLVRLERFPGEKSPGLIEARKEWLAVIASPGRFRGRNPPASLKLSGSIQRRHANTGFPGEKSPGLIEAHHTLLAL